MYPVMVEPPFKGSTQLITTLSPLTVVVGAAGVLGFVEAIIAKAVEAGPYPIALCASTLNLYVFPGVRPVTV
jgi:hypothetical protein